MTDEEREAIKTLSIKAVTSKAECEDYPNCICLKKDLLLILNLIDKQDNRIKELEKAVEEKDKTIDEMAECINNYQICDYEITDYRYRKCEYIADDKKPPCKQCIKEYFEKKERNK